MLRPLFRSLLIGFAVLSALAVGAVKTAEGQVKDLAADPAAMTPPQLMTRPVDPAAPDAALIERGRVLATVGDCVSCHTRARGEPMAGGLGMNTPFGVIYTPNITPDRETGIGGWTADQFFGAMHRGVDDDGRQLYPAFPYVFFSKISRSDSDAVYAYLKTVPAVRYTPPGNALPFPFNIRFLVKGWNLLFFRPQAFAADPGKSAAWNRGAYLVNGLGHCGQCHTPVNALGANDNSRAWRGGVLDNWTAPDLTENRRTGLGAWSFEEVVQYLETGRTPRAQASGPMAEVVSYSTSLMSDADVRAVATYLKDLPAGPDAPAPAADAAALARGGRIYSDACASCHLEGGAGQPGYFPPLGGDQAAQQKDPTGLIHLILAGARTAPTTGRPSPLSMPSFAWKLTDDEVADVATYLRSSFGNQAGPVTPAEVQRLRKALDLTTLHLTAGSGDHGQGS